jgi:hypothetical protein
MLNWLRSIIGWGITGLKDLWNKAIGALITVYNYFVQFIDALDAELISIYHSLSNFISAVETYATALYNSVLAWAAKQISSVISWAENQLASLAKAISAVETWASNLIAALRATLNALISGVESWVINDIYDPLLRSVTDALKWITSDGYLAIQLLTHPDQLAKVLGKWLWGEWLSMLHDYAGPIGSWFIHQMVRSASPVGSVIEDIISSIVD